MVFRIRTSHSLGLEVWFTKTVGCVDISVEITADHPTSKCALSISRGQTCTTPSENGQGKTGGMCTKEKHVHIKIQKGRFIFFLQHKFLINRIRFI